MGGGLAMRVQLEAKFVNYDGELVHAVRDWHMSEDGQLVARAVREYEESLNLMLRKNRDYGGAWREQGWMGNLARILSKTARLKSLLWKDFYEEGGNGEAVQDTVRDLMNLCLFFMWNRDAHNRWGRS
jgi:hypothetical protein